MAGSLVRSPDLPAADGAGVVAFYEACRLQGEMLLLVIADRASDAYLGEVVVVVDEHQVGELGCGLVRAARGRGIASEALRQLAAWSFAALGLGRLHVFVALENLPALRLAERAGFRREGVLRAYWERDGARLDVVVLARFPDDRLGADVTRAPRPVADWRQGCRVNARHRGDAQPAGSRSPVRQPSTAGLRKGKAYNDNCGRWPATRSTSHRQAIRRVSTWRRSTT